MIDLEAVSVRFGSVAAVSDVTLSVDKGELVAVVGESGCGKSTLLKAVNRLVEPTAGRVRVGGEDTTRLPPHALRRRIGYVFQRVGLFPHLTVAANVGMTPELLGWPKHAVDERTDELLALVGLEAAVRTRFPHQLSGGQAQRVAVARALAAKPEVVLFDEPFAALDPLTRARLHEELLRLRRDAGFTSLFVTHDMAEALLLADRIAVMRAGRIVQLATPRALAAAPADAYVADLVGTPARLARRVEEILR